MASVFNYKREAVRIKVMKYDPNASPEYKKFTVDPQLTSYEVLRSFLAKAFDIKANFTVCYKIWDDYGQETFIALLSDWDLDAAFLSASEPYLSLRVDLKPNEEVLRVEEETVTSVETKSMQGIPGFIFAFNNVGKTFNSMLQRALNFTEEAQPALSIPPRQPLCDTEFRSMLRPNGQLSDSASLRSAIYFGGVEPSLRKVVWKHLLNVYPEGLSGKERIDYIKKKSLEYINLRDTWRELLKNGQMIGDLGYVTSMVRKDVLRTDRHHSFYAGSDDNKNIASLFNILTTYAMNHPNVSYCQGMSDLASPLLVTMNDEAHAYICFCALMMRLSPNFLLDGITMTQRFQHLADGLHYYDFPFYSYLKSHQADDLLFCYRWLLLEMKREFAFDDALRMLEVMWSSLPPSPPGEELNLYQIMFVPTPQVPSPRPKENAYTKVCALRRGLNAVSLDERGRGSLVKCKPFASLDDAALREPRRIRNLNEFMTFDRKRQNRTPDSSPDDDSNDYQPMNTSFTQELRLELESLDRHVFGNNGGGGGDNDCCFVWENPLERSPDISEEVGNITSSDLLSRRRKQSTEQHKTSSPESTSSDVLGNGTSYSDATCKSGSKENCESDISSAKSNGSEEPSQSVAGPLLLEQQHEPSDTLPPPHIFGSGNPFLMFLCLTVLTQHRDNIMSQRMDYNEIAMHFDKMVRKHDVTRVLNQARDMFASYLKQHSSNHLKKFNLKV